VSGMLSVAIESIASSTGIQMTYDVVNHKQTASSATVVLDDIVVV